MIYNFSTNTQRTAEIEMTKPPPLPVFLTCAELPEVGKLMAWAYGMHGNVHTAKALVKMLATIESIGKPSNVLEFKK